MRRPGNILLVAIIIGAVVAAWVYRHFRNLEEEFNEARKAPVEATADVMVASDTIPIGTRIAANQIKAVPWPVNAQPDGSVHTPDPIVGHVARMTIEKNQPVIEAQLINEQVGLLPLIITEGMRGMSVRVDAVTGVSGFITPNSHVDVLVTGSPAGSSAERSKIVLQNIRVLATGKTIEQRDEKPVEVPTVTLLVSPADAEKLNLATRVQLALRSYTDEGFVSTPGVSMAALLGREEREPLQPVLAERPVDRPAERRPSVEVVLGDTVTRQSF